MRRARWVLLWAAIVAIGIGCKESVPAGDAGEDEDGAPSALEEAPGISEPSTPPEETADGDEIISSTPDQDEGLSPLGEARAILDGYEPVLSDPKGDAKGPHGERYDVVSALAVASPIGLLVRVTTADAISWSDPTDVRLWIEQDGKMVTVEAKPDHPKKICELTPVNGHDSTEVEGCLHLGEHVDIRIPFDQLPRWLDRAKPYFISGVSTCCIDEARSKPYDEIDGAQEVWIN